MSKVIRNEREHQELLFFSTFLRFHPYDFLSLDEKFLLKNFPFLKPKTQIKMTFLLIEDCRMSGENNFVFLSNRHSL